MKHIFYLARHVLTFVLTLGLISAFGFTRTAEAANAASDWIKTDQTEVRLIAASETVGTGESVKIGLQFKLQPGWKIYWRSPGDAGFPPRLDWNGSTNLQSADTGWPSPERFSVLGLETLGYKKEVVFPIQLRPVTSGQNIDLKLALKYLTCSEICVPYDTEISLTLPAGPDTPSPFAHLIDRYRAAVPGDGRNHGLKIVSAVALENGAWTGLRVRAESDMPFDAPDLFVEGIPELAYGKPKFSLSADRKQAVLDVSVDGLGYVDDKLGKTLVGRNFILTLADGKRSAERKLEARLGSNGEPAPAIEGQSLSFLTILGLALLGGLILNLMPCVLPVLSIKLIGAIGHGGGESRAVRLSFIASAAGIIFSFLVLAGALVAVKASGGAIGWGIQFQQPWFLIAMTAVVILFACNLWGFFEVNLPRIIADLGEQSTNTNGLGGHFAQGAFATLLATPCSAPFLGTAVGFALARGTQEIFTVFGALGLGLALPYLAVALFPALATRLPKPGAWMVRLKQILGFALLATAVWLLSVLYATTSLTNTLILAAMMTAVIVVLYTAHRLPALKSKATPVAVILILAAVLFPVTPEARNNADKLSNTSGIQWQAFDQEAIGRMVAAGHTVLVDVTADWCITCQVNKSLVLGRDPVLSALTDGSVATMQADWTLPSDTIAKYLASFGRYGIPFNAVYGPATPDGITLPELLTKEAVIEAVKKSRAKQTVKASTD